VQAEILNVGTELLLGGVANANAARIGRWLAGLGVDVYRQVAVGDNPVRLANAFRRARQEADVVVVTGGLGPTQDDITREVVASELGLPLEEDAEARRVVEGFFARRGAPVPPSALRQAVIPRGARVIPNPTGTAPGLIVECGAGTAILLPGPPAEVEPMLADAARFLLARLAARGEAGTVIASRTFKVAEAGESEVESRIADLLAQANPTFATLAYPGEVHVRVTVKAPKAAEADGLLGEAEGAVRRRLGDLIFAVDEKTLEDAVGQLLCDRKLTIAVAESCTAGLLAYRLTRVAGSSAYFIMGVASYANRAKTAVLGVSEESLAACGAVSPEVAREMAAGVRTLAAADLGVGITGVAGPAGGTAQKPVGLVYVAIADAAGAAATGLHLHGDRETVRQRAAQAALAMLRRWVLARPAAE
jgi:nicotinamide-nucleotide amidase